MSHCTTCKNGLIHTGSTSVTFDKDNIIIVFRNVPTQVCDVCGDYIIEGSIAQAPPQNS